MTPKASASPTIVVHGIPAPQGSKRHVGGGRMIESSKAVGPWREAIRGSVLATFGQVTPLEGPLSVDVTFVFDRPRSHYGTGRNSRIVRPSAPVFPATRPDLDKLCRALFDALTDAHVWHDDGQVVRLVAFKRWADDKTWSDPGAVIHITDVPA